MKSHRKTEGETERWKRGIRGGEKGAGTEWVAGWRDALISESGEDKLQNKTGDIHGKEMKKLPVCVCVCRGVLAWERECDTGSVPEERKRERGGEQDEEKEVGGGRDTHRERNRHQIHCFHCLIRSAVRERERERGWRDGGVQGRWGEGRGRKMRSNMRRLERDSQTFLPQTEVQRRRWNDLRRKV